jgi:DmsE family decaheme c-type cytochrome
MQRFITRLCATVALALGLSAGAAQAASNQLPELNASSAAEALKQDAVCTKCHDEGESRPILSMYQTKHGVRADGRTPTCQGCHGSSDKHVAGGKGVGEASRPAPDVVFKAHAGPASDAATISQTCIGCHKGEKRTHWNGSQHQSNEVSCVGCHQVHAKADPVLGKRTQGEVCFACHQTERAQTHRVSTHPLNAGKMACSDCHNPHGSAGPKLLAKNTLNETCFACHAEKRGPFLWEHQPVTESCASCHTPHGSNITPLLTSRAPFLCQECHDGPHTSRSPFGLTAGGAKAGLIGALPSDSAAGRGCTNCHSMVHGSNHPAGALLHR